MYSKYTCTTCALIARCLLDVCFMTASCKLCFTYARCLLDCVNGVQEVSHRFSYIVGVLQLQSTCRSVIVCTGFSGFVPLMQNRNGMTYYEATHAALSEFTARLTGTEEPTHLTCSSKPIDTEPPASCHIGCSTQPPRPC